MRGVLLAILLVALNLRAAVVPNLDHGLALQGFDAVAYVQDAKAVKGLAKFSTELGGARYWFKDQAHLESFKKQPERYLPAYGGWCAYAMSKGQLVEVDPYHFKVVQGRLMLFFYAFYNDTLKKWNFHEAELLPKANAQWALLNAGTRP